MHLLPKQGDRQPWINTQDYLLDRKILRSGPIDDGVLTFSCPQETERERPVESHAA